MKKRMRIVALLLAISVCVGLSGCRQPAGESSSAPAQSTQEQPLREDGRTLVWSEEFDGDSLDETKWKFHRTMSAADRIYDNGPEQVQVKDGKLTLTARKDGQGRFILPEGLTTRERMAFRYGYLEISACPPFSPGAWPSFWMQSDMNLAKANYMAEVDIYEIFSSRDSVVSNIHKWGSGEHTMINRPSNRCTYTFAQPENLSREYHTYAMEWDNTKMRFFVDGERYCTFPLLDDMDFDTEKLPGMDGFQDFAYIIFNNEFFSAENSWSESLNVDENSVFPQLYRIDWVRLYQKEGEELYLYE